MLKSGDSNWQTNEDKNIEECFPLSNIFVNKVNSNEGSVALPLQPSMASQLYTTTNNN